MFEKQKIENIILFIGTIQYLLLEQYNRRNVKMRIYLLRIDTHVTTKHSVGYIPAVTSGLLLSDVCPNPNHHPEDGAATGTDGESLLYSLPAV